MSFKDTKDWLNYVLREHVLRYVFMFKLYTGRAHGYVQLPLELAKDFMIAFTFLKVYYPDIGFGVYLPMFFMVILVMLIVGRWDVRNHNAKLEVSINNSINPELMEIHAAVKRMNKPRRRKR